MNDPFAALRDKFLLRCRAERAVLAEIERERRLGDDGRTGELVRLAHGLAGAGGTFGFDRLSEIASRAEIAIAESRPLPQQNAALAALIAELDGVVGAGPER